MRWYEVTVTGQEAHTGATPMRLRKNALLGAARMIERDRRDRARARARRGRHRRPDREPAELAATSCPGEVFFTVDFRHPDDKVLDAMEGEIPRGAARNPRAAEA